MAYRTVPFSPPPFNIRSGSGIIIVVSAAVFILQNIFGAQLLYLFGLTPYLVIKKYYIWQFLTYIFLHGSFFHLFFNMFMLWMFGQSIENSWGRGAFLKYCLITGFGAGLLAVAVNPFSTVPSIGASGVVYGLMAAFAMMYPDAVIYVYFLFPVKARHLVVFFAVFEFIASFSHNTGVANIAHFGGMLTGYLYLKYSFGIRLKFKSLINTFAEFFNKNVSFKNSKSVKGASLADDVDAILEKILVKGADSLTQREKKIMEKYTNSKR